MKTLLAFFLALHVNETNLFLQILISLRPFINHNALTGITIIQALRLAIIDHTEIT
jgi:hypothetical protein